MEHNEWMVPCLYKKYLGINCPGCGFQRSMAYLLKGDLEASIRMYPPLIPILLMFLLLLFHIKFKHPKGHKLLLAMFILNTILIAGNFIVKNIP